MVWVGTGDLGLEWFRLSRGEGHSHYLSYLAVLLQLLVTDGAPVQTLGQGIVSGIMHNSLQRSCLGDQGEDRGHP